LRATDQADGNGRRAPASGSLRAGSIELLIASSFVLVRGLGCRLGGSQMVNPGLVAG